METATLTLAPDRPRFSLTQLLVATTAIAIYLGLLRWVGALAFYFAAVCWVTLLIKQLDPTSRAAARIAAFVWGGVVVPITLLGLPMHLGSTAGKAEYVFAYLLFHWTSALALAIFSSLAVRPRFHSFASGYLAMVSAVFFFIGSAAPVTSLKLPSDDVAPFADSAYVFAQVVACMLGGFIAGTTFLAVSVLIWRAVRQRRAANRKFFLLGFVAVFFGSRWFAQLLA